MREQARVAAYLSAHFGKSGLWHAMSLLLPVVLIDRGGLRPVQMGALTMSAIFLSSILTPAFSALVPRHGDPMPVLGRMQAGGALIAGLLFVACMVLPGGRGWAHLGVAVFLVCLLRAGYAFFDMAQNGLMAMVRTGAMDHATIPAWRMIAGIGAQLAIATSWSMLGPFRAGSGGSLLCWALALSAVATATALLLHAAIRGTPRPAFLAKAAAVPAATGKLPKRLGGVLVAAFACSFLVSGVNRYLPFMPRPPGASGWSDLTLYASGGVAGQVLLLWSRRRFGRDMILRSVLAGVLVANLVLLIPSLAAPVRTTAILGCGGATWALTTLLWTLMSERIADRASDGAASRHAMAFALLTGASECGTGIGELLLGFVVQHARRLGDPSAGMTLMLAGSIGGLAIILAALGGLHRGTPHPVLIRSGP